MTTTKANAAKAALIKGIQDAGGMTSIQLGSTIYMTTVNNIDKVYADVVKKAIRSGEAIQHKDGSREFYEWVEVYNVGRGGSGAYVWHKDGQRCKHKLVKTVVDKDNKAAKSVVKTAWRVLESI